MSVVSSNKKFSRDPSLTQKLQTLKLTFNQTPFQYHSKDPHVEKKVTPQYYPPNKRKEMKDYLSKTSIKFNQQMVSTDQRMALKSGNHNQDSIIIMHDLPSNEGVANGNKSFNTSFVHQKKAQKSFSVNRQRVLRKTTQSVSLEKNSLKKPLTNPMATTVPKNWWKDQETVSSQFFQNPSKDSKGGFNPTLLKEQLLQSKQKNKEIQKILKKCSFQVGFETAVDYRSTKTQLHDQPMQESFQDYVPFVEEKRNKKNDSKVVFDVQRKSRKQFQSFNESEFDQIQTNTFQNQGQQTTLSSPTINDKMSNPKYQELIEKARNTLNKRLQLRKNSSDQAFVKVKQELRGDQTIKVNNRNQSSLFKDQISSKQDAFILKTPMKYQNQEQLIQKLNQRSFSVNQYQMSNIQENSLEHQQNFQMKTIEDQRIKETLKNQNFHISGSDHQLKKRPLTQGGNRATKLQQYQQQVISSPQKNSHYRTSFQDQFMKKSMDNKFHFEAQKIHEQMKKGNISLQNTIDASQILGLQESFAPNSARVDKALDYENQNFVNHLPFQNEQLANQQRFNSYYRSLYQEKQNKSQLLGNYVKNNDLNQFYMDRILQENHYLGKCDKSEMLNNLQSEKQVRYYRTNEHRQDIIKEIVEGQAPQQLREEFKEKIERQNFNVKQPEISGGDLFFEDLGRKTYSLGQTKDFQQFKLDQSASKFGQGFQTGTVMNRIGSQNAQYNVSVKEFNQLNFKDQMKDQTKTNFHFGNIERSRTIDASVPDNFQEKSILTQSKEPFVNFISPQKTTQSILQHAFQSNQQNQRPQTASSVASTGLLKQQNHQKSILLKSINGFSNVNNQQSSTQNYDYARQQMQSAEKIKRQQTQSRVCFGNDSGAHQTRSDYRQNFMWTIPKFAM
eukprot:403365148